MLEYPIIPFSQFFLKRIYPQIDSQLQKIMDDFREKMVKMKTNPKDYMEALEEERRKIQVFHRELPLCLELVNEAIENCKKKQYLSVNNSNCEEHPLSTHDEGPVLEEFLPLKGSTTSSSFVEENDEQTKSDEKLGKKADWLKSAQLWNQNPELPSMEVQFLKNVQNLPLKCSKVELKKSCEGAFQPFKSELKGTTSTPPPTTATTAAATSTNMSAACSVVQTAATSSTNGDTVSGNGTKRKKEEKESELRRKTRRSWSQELHKRFLEALQQLGGSHVATPKQIKELMKVDGLTNDEVKSHLQKYRIHTRGSNPTTTHDDGNPQPPPQFVVVGGIWVPPPEYIKEGNARMTTNGIYVPLAAPPQQQAAASCSQQQQKQLHQSPTGSLHSEGRSNRVERSADIHSNSSTPSSSTETT